MRGELLIFRQNQRLATHTPHFGSRILYDEEIPGFGVRITANSVISFVLDYRINERKRRYTIGQHPELSAAAAREKAIQLRSALRTGEDPLADKKHRREAPTIEDLFNDLSLLKT